jgi:hypothetical protein
MGTAATVPPTVATRRRLQNLSLTEAVFLILLLGDFASRTSDFGLRLQTFLVLRRSLRTVDDEQVDRAFR